MSTSDGTKGTGREEVEDDDLEMLRQAALRTIGMNRNKPKNFTQTRMKTKGNLIEIQPAEIVQNPNPPDPANAEEFLVEEFVIDEGSDVSINSSDCDEVIEEVIVSDPEDEGDDSSDKMQNDTVDGENKPKSQQNYGKSKSRSRSRSLSSNHQSSDESDAVSIQSSYSLILDDGLTGDDLSVEAKFLSRKAQKSTGKDEANNGIPDHDGVSTERRQSNRSRSPLPFRTDRTVGRRSRSRERGSNNRNRSVTRRSSRSRSPLLHPTRRRNNLPVASSSRGNRRPYRTNSSEKSNRRRRSWSRSPSSRSPHPLSSNRNNQSSRRARSNSRTPPSDNTKQNKSRSSPKSQVVNSASIPHKSPSEDKVAGEKVAKNDKLPVEEMERLEKRRRKFEGDVVAPAKKVIKITGSTSKDRPTASKGNSVLKEKVQKAGSKRSVELVTLSTSSSNQQKEGKKSEPDKVKNKTSTSSSAPSTASAEDDQEDLRTRLIKKKLEKMQQSGSSSSSSGPLSSVVVVSMGSQRIFSQALKNSQRSAESGSSKSSHSRSKSPQSESLEFSSSKSTKAKSETSDTTRSRNSSGSTDNKKMLSSSSSTRSGVSSSGKGSSKSKTSTTKRVVSVTYSL